ncbi:MAG: hypothetical protein SWZ49_00520 [Cyanobacteriota bacterium]|nr:hypothetical protein [Cyanobacteriota bacterium]
MGKLYTHIGIRKHLEVGYQQHYSNPISSLIESYKRGYTIDDEWVERLSYWCVWRNEELNINNSCNEELDINNNNNDELDINNNRNEEFDINNNRNEEFDIYNNNRSKELDIYNNNSNEELDIYNNNRNEELDINKNRNEDKTTNISISKDVNGNRGEYSEAVTGGKIAQKLCYD